ncbi:MAG: hypothetical protein M9921_00180 [Fimbriimonadaceae bacterium]|nr:hypothetical protein [Fimbriimonadaceae bacterium]
MLTLYIVTAIVGGAMVLVSALMGGHDADTDHDFTHDADVHVEVDSDTDSDAGADHGGDHAGPWLPFFSLRFWTYLLAAFGLTGVLLTWLTDTPQPTVLTWSIAMGLVVGLAVSYLMLVLKRIGVDSSISSSDMLGIEARVTVPIRGALMGRVRCNVKGEALDVFATSDEDRVFEEGQSVVIVEMVGDKARVVSREDVFG